MNSRKGLGYSVCIAAFITAMSYVFYSWGGELFVYPGKFIDSCFNFLIFYVAEEMYPDHINTSLFFNMAFYTLITYALLWLRVKVSKSTAA